MSGFPQQQPNRRTVSDPRAYVPGWMGSQARFGDEYADAADSAAAGGGALRVVGGGGDSGGNALDALRRGSIAMGGGPAPAGGNLDATGYQAGRAALDRELNDNFAAKSAQQDAMNARDRAKDPGIQDYEEQEARHRADEDSRANDVRAIDSFARTESLRRVQQREKAMNAAEMLPFNPAVAQSASKLFGVEDTNAARRDVATTAAGARELSAATSAYGRVASAPTFGPDDSQRVTTATDALGRRAGLTAAPADPSKVFPEVMLGQFAQESGFPSPEAAREYLERVHHYTIK